jgi:hypothetical protein
MIRQEIIRTLLYVLVAVFLGFKMPISFAQGTTEQVISGTVTDPTGSVVPEAKVVVTKCRHGD